MAVRANVETVFEVPEYRIQGLLFPPNAPGYLQILVIPSKMFKVEYLCNATTLFLQPLKGRNITTVKNHRMQVRRSYVSVNECWRSNNIADCIVNIKQFTDKLKIHGSE